jgi:hypothetical protein
MLVLGYSLLVRYGSNIQDTEDTEWFRFSNSPCSLCLRGEPARAYSIDTSRV